jgi:hypothetical protein
VTPFCRPERYGSARASRALPSVRRHSPAERINPIAGVPVRLASGELIRGKIEPFVLEIDGKKFSGQNPQARCPA